MNYKEIEPEYLDFIKKQKYGTPIAFAKTSLKQEWEAYFAGHEKFQAYCVFGGWPVPPTSVVGLVSSLALSTVASQSPRRPRLQRMQNIDYTQDMFFFQQWLLH